MKFRIHRPNSSNGSTATTTAAAATTATGLSASSVFGYCMIVGLCCCFCNMIYITMNDIHIHDVVLSDLIQGGKTQQQAPPKSVDKSSKSSIRKQQQEQHHREQQQQRERNRNDIPQKQPSVDTISNNKKNNDPDRSQSRLSDRKVQTLPPEWSTNNGNNPIRQLLMEAIGNTKHNINGRQQDQLTIDEATIHRLPSVQDVSALYGSTPIVLGLETCDQFQNQNPVKDPADHLVSVAGAFNTGTNLLAELLIANCYIPARQAKYETPGVRWQVLWGKHTPVDDEQYRRSHRTYKDEGNEPPISPDAMFPAITIRDPFKWMQSMCRHSYGADWVHDPAHCPNLVPNEIDEQFMEAHQLPITSTMNVTVYYADFVRQHMSLVEFWNDWNRAYVEASFPRLIVRFEDIVFHPKQITKTVCECAGGQLYSNQPFKYVVESAKKGAAHGAEKTSYVDALVKYGTETGRYTGFTKEDLQYAQQFLDPNLMRLFGYHYPKIDVD